MKRTLLACIFGITTFWHLVVSLEAFEKEEDESLLFLMAARNAAKAGWANKAIQRYDAYLRKNPDDEVVVLEFADFLQESGHYRKAEAHYDTLIQRIGHVLERKNGFTKKLMLNAARNAVKNGNVDRAVEYYKQALSSNKGNSKIAEELAGILARLGRFGEALELYEKTLLHDPENLEVLTLKVNLLVQLKKYAEARETLEKIPYEEKSNLKLLRLEADVDAWSGNYGRAIEKYQDLVNRFPENRDIRSHYIKVLSWAKKWSLLLDTIREERDKIEVTDDIRSTLVGAYLSLGEDEKAIEVWKTIHRKSDTWRTTSLMIVDKFLSRRKLTEASNLLEEIVSVSKPVPEVHLAVKLAIIYACREMPGKGFEVLNQFPVSPESKPIIDITKAEILALTGRYEDALSILHTLEGDKKAGFRPQIVELECYYALEKDEILLEKSSMILQKLSIEERIDKSKVLTLRVLSYIRMGLYKEAEKEIELLSETNKEDLCPAILTVLLHDAKRQLNKYEESVLVLGKLLSEYSTETEMVRPQLFDDVPLSAWKAADEVAMHRNQEVTAQYARAEFKAGNFLQSLDLYKELDEKNKDQKYRLGMVECYLNLGKEGEANKVFEEIQIRKLPEKEIVRYCEALVKLRRNKQALYAGLSLLPKDISEKIVVKGLTIIANIQSEDYDIANGMMKKYLSNQPGNMTVFQAIVEQVGYFDRGRKSKNYEFAKDWLCQAVEQFPGDPGLRYQYARLLATHNEYDLACEQFLTLQKNSPKDVRILRWLAQVNSWRREYDESLRWYDFYLREQPTDFKRRREVARVYGWALRLKDANEAYKNLCWNYAEDFEIYWEWQAKRNNWLGRKQTAISFYNKLVGRHPEDTEMLFDLGQMYSQLNVSSKSEDAYKNCLPMHQNTIVPLLLKNRNDGGISNLYGLNSRISIKKEVVMNLEILKSPCSGQTWIILLQDFLRQWTFR
ncbi:MAG: tetratricopeptide repeat protein [Candidatus Brocadia sp.]|nr:tetratricopeptide repeat protein [Candidatus Brocadia sp.]